MPGPMPEPLKLSNDHLELEILPSLGGKLASLIDRRTGRDWLWHNPYLRPSLPRYGSSYVMTADSGGFDECFPAVAEGPYPTEPWRGVAIPDHGELWGLPWEVEATEPALRLAVDGVRFPYRFERRMQLDPAAASVTLAYEVTNRAPFPFPFVWSAHPLLAIRPGMQLLIPEDLPLRVFGSSSGTLGELGTPLWWPALGPHDLTRLPGAEAGFAVKLFGPAPTRGWVGLHDPETATTLRFDFDPHEVPHLGLWLNMGGWCPLEGREPYYNLGLEPCIGAGDDLELAVRHFRAHGVVPARGAVRWHLRLSLVREELP